MFHQQAGFYAERLTDGSVRLVKQVGVPEFPVVMDHTIPVPRGWSVEQSWEAIRRGDLLTDPVPLWANVEVDPRGRMVRVSEAPVDPA